MNGQEAFRRFAQQLQRAGQSGGSRIPGGSKGFFAGSGLLVALVGGGLALNASLFNGTCGKQFIAYALNFNLVTVDGGHRAIKYTR